MSVGLMQRVLAGYRVPLFDMLAEKLPGGLQLYAGTPRHEEIIDSSQFPQKAILHQAHNRYLFNHQFNLCVQTDVLIWLKKVNPSVLIQEANLRYPMSALAANWMHHRNRAVIGWGLGTGSTGGILLKRHLTHFDALITYSAQGKESYTAAGFPAERIYIARNSVSPKPCREMPNRAETFGQSPIILYVGRLQERKRLDFLIHCCASLPKEIQPCLWIVGDGPIRDGLESLAKSTYPNTHFFGAQYGDALTEIFDRADIFVLPGTGGLALQQAMASALPLIAAEADGTQVDLVRPENGIQVIPGDSEDLINAMKTLLRDPQKARAMGRESFRIVSEEINLEAMVDTFAQAVTEVKPR